MATDVSGYPVIEIVRGNGHESLPAWLREEWLVVACDCGEWVAISSWAQRSDAVAFQVRERRLNRRVGRVHYSAGFPVLQQDGSWVVQ